MWPKAKDYSAWTRSFFKIIVCHFYLKTNFLMLNIKLIMMICLLNPLMIMILTSMELCLSTNLSKYNFAAIVLNRQLTPDEKCELGEEKAEEERRGQLVKDHHHCKWWDWHHPHHLLSWFILRPSYRELVVWGALRWQKPGFEIGIIIILEFYSTQCYIQQKIDYHW